MFASVNTGLKWADRGLVTSYDYGLGDFIEDGEWHEKDLSSIVGKGVKLLCISIGYITTESNKQFALRTAGQTNTKNFGSMFTQASSLVVEHSLWVLTDADGKIDYYVQTGTWTILQVCIRGWFV